MKKIISILIALTVAANLFAQSGESIYKKYSGREGAEVVYISPAMFRLIGKLPLETMESGDEMVDIAPLVKSLKGFYLVSISNPAHLASLKADVESFLSSGKYELLMEARDFGNGVKIYMVSQGDYINSLVLLAAEADSTTFICLDGRILLADLEKMLARAY